MYVANSELSWNLDIIEMEFRRIVLPFPAAPQAWIQDFSLRGYKSMKSFCLENNYGAQS